MKKIIFLMVALTVATTGMARKKKKTEPEVSVEKSSVVMAPLTDLQKMSYALGANMGEGMLGNATNANITLDLEAMLKGFSDAYQSKNMFSEEEMSTAYALLDSVIMAEQKKSSEKDRTFLEENKKLPGVIVTPSGLQYKVVTMGTGVKPSATDQVTVHYHGTTIDGMVFDSSVQRGEPITFGLNQVIKGWTEGVQLMPVGSKFIFYIPAELAYGEQGAGGVIKPGATLIFEIELLEVEDQMPEIQMTPIN